MQVSAPVSWPSSPSQSIRAKRHGRGRGGRGEAPSADEVRGRRRRAANEKTAVKRRRVGAAVAPTRWAAVSRLSRVAGRVCRASTLAAGIKARRAPASSHDAETRRRRRRRDDDERRGRVWSLREAAALFCVLTHPDVCTPYY